MTNFFIPSEDLTRWEPLTDKEFATWSRLRHDTLGDSYKLITRGGLFPVRIEGIDSLHTAMICTRSNGTAFIQVWSSSSMDDNAEFRCSSDIYCGEHLGLACTYYEEIVSSMKSGFCNIFWPKKLPVGEYRVLTGARLVNRSVDCMWPILHVMLETSDSTNIQPAILHYPSARLDDSHHYHVGVYYHQQNNLYTITTFYEGPDIGPNEVILKPIANTDAPSRRIESLDRDITI